MASLHPDHGARIVLTLETGEPVRYRVALYEPDSIVHATIATLTDASFSFSEWGSGDAPPRWVVTYAERWLTSLANKHRESGRWPRKLTRWREQRIA